MVMMRRRLLCTALCMLTISSASAVLIDSGGGMVYDTTLNITWIADINFFGTQASTNPDLVSQIIESNPTVPSAIDSYSSYGVGGSTGLYTLSTSDFLVRPGDTSLMTWYGAQAWASQLDYGGYSDWRVAGNLFFIDDVFTNEVRDLWMNNFGISLANPDGNAAITALFANGPVNFGGGYWLGSELDSIGHSGLVSSCVCSTASILGSSTVINRWNVMIVRDGGIATVPEPGTLSLLGLGLVGLGFVRRKRTRHNDA